MGSGPFFRDERTWAQARTPSTPLEFDPSSEEPCTSARLEWLIWAFVGLGILIRLVRYFLNHPLWGDESFVSVHFLTRDYRGLLRPLDHGMVCPLLFLWIERAFVDCLGFNEMALRLFPTISSLASVLLFRYWAGRAFRGIPLLIAVAVFSVSFYPIRHGADVKPYASDLVAGFLLWIPVIEWWRSRNDRWLWILTGLIPLALVLSHPAIFVAGGISLGIGGAIWRSRDRKTVVAYAVLNVVLVLSFLALYLLFTGPLETNLAQNSWKMYIYWASGFPPLTSPGQLLIWLLRAHTGHMFAYPAGGDRGASTATALLFLVGVLALLRRRQFTLLGICTGPFALAFIASALHRYPYGGSTRTMLFLAPPICLLTGYGTAMLLARLRHPPRRRRLLGAAIVGLAAMGLTMIGYDFAHPYYSLHDLKAREFAKRFWPAQSQNAELICLRKDLGIAFTPNHWHLIRTPLYLCNQAIYSGRRPTITPDWNAVSPNHPLRFVLFDEHPLGKSSSEAWQELPELDPSYVKWLSSMSSQYALKSTKTYVVNEGVCENEIWFEDRYVVHEFTTAPRQSEVLPLAGGKDQRESVTR